MADLKKVLTETLAEHFLRAEDSTRRIGTCGTDCDWSGAYEDHPAHQADVLLGLSGVAVTQLPEPDHIEPGDEFENGRTDYALGDVSVYDDGEIHLFGAVWQLADIKNLAAALLAAGVFSEGATND